MEKLVLVPTLRAGTHVCRSAAASILRHPHPLPAEQAAPSQLSAGDLLRLLLGDVVLAAAAEERLAVRMLGPAHLAAADPQRARQRFRDGPNRLVDRNQRLSCASDLPAALDECRQSLPQS